MLRRSTTSAMMRRTQAQQSFSVSHKALCFRANKPLLGADMTSDERVIAAWDDLHWQWFIGPRTEMYKAFAVTMMDFGIRLLQAHTRMRIVCMQFWLIMLPIALWITLWPSLHLVLFGELPPAYMGQTGVANSKKYYGLEVWCADGKFLTPWTHIKPPHFTMRVEDL